MKTSTRKLNTVADILAIFTSVASDKAICSRPESIELMKDLSALLLSTPVKDIASCIFADATAINETLVAMFNLYPHGSEEQKAVVAKGLSLVDEFVKAGNLDDADTWLVRGYNFYPYGSEEEKAVVARGLSLVDEFVRAGNLDDADSWLVRGCNMYPRGSVEEKAVVAKRLSQVDEFVKAGNLDAADTWLVRGYNFYPRGSEEEKAVVARRLSQVDEFVKAGNLDAADNWLVRGYHLYDCRSKEEKAILAKRAQLKQLRCSKQMGVLPRVNSVLGLARRKLADGINEMVGLKWTIRN